ncbi:MAG: hypothetical protein IH940_12180, partial [Acidobacteria bacterium]|nr:hypothetical protein [Acidobacteriota bacterium]
MGRWTQVAFRYLTLGIVLSSVAFASCSSGDPSPDESASTTAPPALAFAEESPPGAVSLDIGLREQEGFDPVELDGTSIGAAAVSDLLYRSLTRIDGDGKVEPDGADEWSHNGEATRWNFHIADDLVFSDGSGVTAGDVVSSLERALEEAPRHMTIGLEDVQTIVAADNSTVVLRLSEPDLDVAEALNQAYAEEQQLDFLLRQHRV